MNTKIKKNASKGIANELSKILSEEYVLYTKTKNAQWNIESYDVDDQQEFFERQFIELDTIVNSIAERIRTLGNYVDAMLKAFLCVTNFTNQKRTKYPRIQYLQELLMDHELLIKLLKGNITVFTLQSKDSDTCDFITGLIKNHEKMAWIIRIQLK